MASSDFEYSALSQEEEGRMRIAQFSKSMSFKFDAEEDSVEEEKQVERGRSVEFSSEIDINAMRKGTSDSDSDEEGEGEGDEDGERSGAPPDRRKTLKREVSKRKLIHTQMLSYKQKGSYDMAEDIYAFILAAPVFSAPFLFAVVVICIKYVVYVSIIYDIKIEDLKGAETAATAVKFFLIPVAVAMQEDLMSVYAGIANARYDIKVLEISESATEFKFRLSYILRLIDGLCSLIVNFVVMLTTSKVISVFLNFAALHFLQDIDDVFYSLVEKGFFGDYMEHMSTICKQISWPRRTGTSKLSKFLTYVDAILFWMTFTTCLAAYLFVTFKFVLNQPRDKVDKVETNCQE